MRNANALPILIFFVIFGIGLAVAYSTLSGFDYRNSVGITIGSAALAFIVSYSVKIANQWERAVVLRLGRFRALKGPGLFFIIPIIDVISYWIDVRVITSAFKAEKTPPETLCRSMWTRCCSGRSSTPKKAALDVADYTSAINWASQTALRDVIGKTLLSETLLEGREKISDELQRIIDVRTEPWGVNVISVEVKDVLIPSALEDAMSMQAQAERERQARVILGGLGAPDRREIRRGCEDLCR